jgi:hypothetical protein
MSRMCSSGYAIALLKCFGYVTCTFDLKKKVTNLDLKEYEGALNFATDAWTSPNHKAFVAFTVHFEHEGVPISMLLDLVEVAKSHTGENLAEAFENVLKEFGVDDKVSNSFLLHKKLNTNV